MVRPSNKKERTAEILDAFEWCVARYGVAGSTLEKIADQADLARALIRHHIGNKESLLDLLVDRVIDKSDQAVSELTGHLPDENRSQQLVTYLFDADRANQQLMLVFSALITAANDRPHLATKLNQWVHNFIRQIASQIEQQYPEQSSQQISIVAAGITGIYFNVDSLDTLGDISQLRKHSQAAALMLLGSLNTAA